MDGDLNLDPATRLDPDVPSGQASESGAHALPQTLDLTCANVLRDRLLSMLGASTITLDAGSVEQMSTPCAQVLLSAGRAAVSAGAPFKIVNASAVFRAAIADLGLQPEFSKWMD